MRTFETIYILHTCFILGFMLLMYQICCHCKLYVLGFTCNIYCTSLLCGSS